MKKANLEEKQPKTNIKLTDYILPIFVLFFIVLSAVSLIKPRVESLLASGKKIEKSQEKLAKITKKVNYLQSYSQVDLENKTNQLLKVLPSQKDVSGLVFALKSLSQETGLEISSLNLDPGELATESAEAKKDKENLMEVSLMIVGPEEKIYEYMDKIESSAPVSKVVKYSTTKDEGAAEAKLSLETYYLPIPKTLGKAEEFTPITTEEEKVWEKVKLLRILETTDSLPVIDSGKNNPFSF